MVKVLSVDIADTGRDANAACVRLDRLVLPLYYRDSLSLMATVGWIIQLYREHDPDYILVDAIGIGAGVYSRLKEQGYPAHPFISSRKAGNRRDRSGTVAFANLRSYCWWALRENLAPHVLNPLPLLLPPDDKLLGDLTTPTYDYQSNGTLIVESKKTIRERLGRSTDAGDALMQTMWKPPEYKPRKLEAVEVPIHA